MRLRTLPPRGLAAALIILVVACFAPPSHAAAPDLAARRAQSLRHGVNLSHWFAQVGDPAGYTKAHFDATFSERDAELIRQMGFDHVRFTVEPAPMFDEKAPEQLDAEYLGLVDAAIDMLLHHGLAVIVDIHPSDEFKRRLNTDDAHADALARFWGALAAHLARTDPDRVFLEVLNEPMVTDHFRWAGIQARVVRAMRAGAPRHTIIVTAANWSNPEDLLEVELVADPNVIYNFHFYSPHTFTHQGATWGSPEWPFLKGVPYPSSPEVVAPHLAGVANDAARHTLEQYGAERWDAAHVEAVIAKMADWAKARGVPLTCNEFGVFREYSDPAARAAWLRDVRTALERHQIGWTMWDYAGGFGVVNGERGARTPDRATLDALGLSARAAAR